MSYRTYRTYRTPTAITVVMLVLLSLTVPLVGTATANHPANTCLDLSPETDTNPVGTVHRITATLRTIAAPTAGETNLCDQDDAARPLQAPTNGPVQIDFEIVGANDPEGASSTTTTGGAPNPGSPESPDLTCTIVPAPSDTIDPDEQYASCTVEYQGTRTGTDHIRGWIDEDGTNGNQGGATEADVAEGRDEETTPGTGCFVGTSRQTPPEPDCTDVVAKTWEAGPPAGLDCDDAGPPDTEHETNPHNAGAASNEQYTCTVTDQFGNPSISTTDRPEGSTVFGEVENEINDPDGPPEGPSFETPDYRCNTKGTGDDDAVCTVTVTQADNEIGTARICFWVEENEAGGTTANPGPTYAFPDPLPTDDPNTPENEGAQRPNEGEALCLDAETTNEAVNADGSDQANDRADEVEKTWEARRASSVDAEPETDQNQPGEQHTITAFVYDQFGSPFNESTQVRFEFFQGSPSDTDGNTPSTPDRTCTTQNSQNSCSTTYTSTEEGLDRVCVFVGATPNMQGDNNTGTCDGEGLTDDDDEVGTADAPDANDDQDVVQKRWGAAGTAGTGTRLDCNPETDSNPTGTGHTITCTVQDNQGNIVTGENIDVEATGANDPDNGDSPQTPDFTCNTNSSGQCSFTHGTGGTGTTNSIGQTTYRAWIDTDNSNATDESDRTEGQAETTQGQGGTRAEPDNTDVVTKTWTGQGRRIDCEPETATNQAGTDHVVTCTVTDAQNAPVQGESVTFTETGVGEISGSSTATTDQNGRATVTTTSSEPGEQTITGTLTSDTTGSEPDEVDECDRAANDPSGAPAGECSDSVTKTWTQPPPPQCSDGVDNDGDGEVDHPNDPGCQSATDDDETDEFPHQEFGGEQGQMVTEGACAGFTTGSVQQDPNGSGLVIVGTNGADALQGSEAGDLICALDGDDAVQAHGGNDTVHGGGGKDAIEAGAGDDAMFGEGDKDVILGDAGNDDLRGGQGNDNMSGGDGADELRGQGGWDTLKGNSDNDLLVGAKGRDVLQGGGGADVARAGADDDVLKGFDGNDELRGGSGDDIIKGAKGRDRLFGNAGDDFLDGGPGKDRCRGGRGRDITRSC